MKNLKDIIVERLHINKDIKSHYYNYHPKTKDELKDIIKQKIELKNNVDISVISDISMSFKSASFPRSSISLLTNFFNSSFVLG